MAPLGWLLFNRASARLDTAPYKYSKSTSSIIIVIPKFLRLVFAYSYFTAAIYIINIIDMAAVYIPNIPQSYENVMHRKALLWLRLPSSEWRGWISPSSSPVHSAGHQQNRLPTTILIYYGIYSTVRFTVHNRYLVPGTGTR